MKDLSYVLMTWHRTILDVTDDGELRHGNARRDAPPRLLLDDNGRCLFNLPIGRFADCVVERLGGAAEFVVRKEGGFITAVAPEHGGGIQVAGTQREWETFLLVPLEEALKLVTPDTPSLSKKRRASSIAKNLHQTSRSDTVPPLCASAVAQLCALNPSWSYRYWSNKDVHDFIYDYFGWRVLESFMRITACYGAARADLFRYLCVYQFGGVYLDIKSTATTSLDAIIQPDDQYLLSQWRNKSDDRYEMFGIHDVLRDVLPGGEYQQWHIFGTAGHPFLEAVIERVLENIEIYDPKLHHVGWRGVLELTGPIAYTLSINPIRLLHPHRMIDAEQVGLVYEASPRPEKTSSYARQTAPVVT